MADPTNIPGGWAKDPGGSDNGYFSAEFRDVTKRFVKPGAGPGDLDYAYSVNPQTGDRIVYGINPNVLGFGSRTPIMSINSSGQVTKLSGYSQIELGYGSEGINALISSSKSAATSLMRQTGTTDAVKNSSEFRSSLANAPRLNPDGSRTGGTAGDGSGGDPNNAGGEGGFLDQSALQDIGKGEGIADAGNVRKSYSKDLKYPFDLNTSKQDYIKISMFKYVPTPLSAAKIATGEGFDSSGRSSQNRNSIGQCILPIQGQLADTNTIDWSSSNISPMEAMAASAAYGLINTSNVARTADTLAQASNTLLKNASGPIKEFLATAFAGQAANAQNLLARTTGAIINPNMELLFNGPQLRQFTLNFRLSPRNKTDVDNVRKIIRFFKQGMSVKQSSSALFLKSPNTFKVQYINAGVDHPYIGKTKECALLNCTVNYIPEGTYMTFQDAPSMTSYDMSLTFTELTPLYDGDYGNDDSNVGY